MNRLGPCRLPHQFTVTRLVASTLHPGNVTENDQRLIALPSLPSLPSLWGSPAVLALRFQVGLGFGEPVDHVQAARFGSQMQWSEASEVQKDADPCGPWATNKHLFLAFLIWPC